MKNNINKYHQELYSYCKDSIATSTYNEWHYKYLQEKLKNEILRSRLKNCKEDNKREKNKLKSCIKFLMNDKQDSLKIRSVSDIVWDLDNTLSLMIANMLIKFRSKVQGIPNDIAKKYNNDDDDKAFKEWCDLIDKMAEAFYLIHDKDSIDITEEENEKIKNGLDLFTKYFRDLWC